MVYIPVAHFHRHIAYVVFAAGVAVGHLAAYHALDDPFFRELIHALHKGLNALAIADNGDLIGAIADFIELVGDDDARDALGFLELNQQIQQFAGVAFVQGRGGFVQNEQLHILGKGFGDFNKLLLTHTDVFDQRGGGVVQTNHGHVFGSFLVGHVPVDHAVFGLLIAQKHVFSNAQVRNQRQFLVDDNDAYTLAIFDVFKPAFVVLIDNIASIGAIGIDTAENIHQRGLASAVFATEGMDLAFRHLNVHVVQRLNAGELFGDILHFEDCIAQKTFLPKIRNGRRTKERPSPVVRRSYVFV